MVVLTCMRMISAGSEAIGQEHKQQCSPGENLIETAELRDETVYRNERVSVAEAIEMHSRPSLEQQRAAEAGDTSHSGYPTYNHNQTLRVTLAPLVSVTPTAAVNAAMLLYARTSRALLSPEGRDMAARSGWPSELMSAFLAVFCLLAFGRVKFWNSLLSRQCHRVQALPASGSGRFEEIKQRLACLAILFTIRALLRDALDQDAFVHVSTAGSGRWTLLVTDALVGPANG
ncbi:hypothetical protein B0A50_05270 [Salinomyces thailandicus]|uniref:Uncharacterized protein n=1 Tax=Salinomyces thailandicus TaxID=706561 RepID=A0A4U0TVX4_9PEZI|nr:hypothetical protein B0A50_05270 [Salinomyces thailandica]